MDALDPLNDDTEKIMLNHDDIAAMVFIFRPTKR
jgi:hypothetical protein